MAPTHSGPEQLLRMTDNILEARSEINAVWRMWHFHCSQILDDGGKRFVSE